MRIIAGKFRSQPLPAPKGWKTRPTSDRLRETLFNVLAPRIHGAVFADLFAGTGAVGIEALSRGARQVYFAENAKPPLEALRGNLEKFRLGPEAQVESAGTLPLLRRLLKQGIRLDIVFLDPPYSDQEAYETTLQFLAEHSALSAEAVVVAEHARRATLFETIGSLKQTRIIEQGEASLSFFGSVPSS
ncbi:MAG: 16S rRNA (guanine(966)-N(2))-methyltransferase RsmD [Armatimonadota bacterium]|nr:16S rRNA (guanine(966)-N(2))-methyltransferase RsmD [Armatimonadota bacterium]